MLDFKLQIKNILVFVIRYADFFTIGLGLLATIIVMILSNKRHYNSYQLRAYIPTIWTSLGIFFTFLAIYVGLRVGATEIEGGEIKPLIDKIIPAFSTSIIGIFGSIVTSLINRIQLAHSESDREFYFDRLNTYSEIDADSPELLLFKIISAVNQKGNSIESILRTNQTTTTGKSDEIFGKFDELLNKLNDSTKEEVRKEFDSFKTKMEVLNGVSNNKLENALKTQKSDFLTTIEKMEKAFEGTITTQNRIIENKLHSLQGTLDTRIEAMKTTNEGLINRLIDVVQKDLANESEKRNQQLQAFIEKENGELKQFIEKQESLYQEIKGNLVNTVSDIRKLFENDVKQTIEQFAEKQHEISANTIELCNAKLIEDSNEYLKNHTGMMSVYLAKLENQMNNTCDTFLVSVDTMLGTIKEKLDELHEKENGLIKTTIEGNTTNIGRLLEENKAAIKTIADGIKEDYEKIKEELEASQERWKEQATQIEKDNLDKIKAINADAEGKVQAINSAISTLGEGLKNSFEGVKGEVKEAIDSNKTSLEELLSANELSIKTVSDKVKKDNDNIVTELTSAQKRWKDAATEMEREHLGEIKKINQDAANEMQSIQTKITKIESALHTSLDSIMEKVTKSIEHFEEKQKEIKSFVLENNKGLQTDLTKQIHDAFQINELSMESSKLATAINDTINSLNTQTNNILSNLRKINDSLNESSEKYNNTVVNSNELITYITSTLNLFKSHITDMSILCSEMSTLHSEVETFQKALDELEKSIKQVQDLNKEVESKVKQDKH